MATRINSVRSGEMARRAPYVHERSWSAARQASLTIADAVRAILCLVLGSSN
ncbi:MAG: hypothetical protein H6872_10430 [Methylobacteriaceae bacterium]|nr:hypothetical protein [Rhodoblastus sp.]MCC0005534.1 hypothetical protein [Methylobacteriaceae bacterium]